MIDPGGAEAGPGRPPEPHTIGPALAGADEAAFGDGVAVPDGDAGSAPRTVGVAFEASHTPAKGWIVAWTTTPAITAAMARTQKTLLLRRVPM